MIIFNDINIYRFGMIGSRSRGSINLIVKFLDKWSTIFTTWTVICLEIKLHIYYIVSIFQKFILSNITTSNTLLDYPPNDIRRSISINNNSKCIYIYVCVWGGV